MKDRLGFWEGRVDLEAKGPQIERFLECCFSQKIHLISPRRQEDGRLNFTVSPKEFFLLRPIAFKTGTRIRIIKKRGFFCAIRPFRKRLGLALGLVLFLSVIFYSSRFVWQVEVKGCQTVSYTQIREDLEKMGLFIGCRRTLDVGKIENRYLMGNDKLSWMSINIKGTTAFVEVKEKGIPPVIEDLSTPTNIYAARDGVILAITDYGGVRQVQVGEPVMAGDLLVSGDWTDKYGVRRLSHSIATVIASTKRETQITVPLSEQLRVQTGKKQKKFEIYWGKFKFPLYFKQKISYNEYDRSFKDYPLRIGNFAFPFGLRVVCLAEVEVQSVKRTEEEAKSLAMTRLGFYERDRLSGVEIAERNIKEEVTDGAVCLLAEFSCREEIGIALPIKE